MDAEELVILCEKMQAGDSAAFGTLYQELYTPLYRFSYGLTRSREEAQDLVQNTFKKMAKSIFAFKGGKVLAWLFTIARNTYYDSRKKVRKEVVLDESAEDIFVKLDTPDDAEENAQLMSLMQNVKQLPDSDRELIMLRYWRGLDMKQIASIIGKTHEGVRKSLSRLIKKLRQQTL